MYCTLKNKKIASWEEIISEINSRLRKEGIPPGASATSENTPKQLQQNKSESISSTVEKNLHANNQATEIQDKKSKRHAGNYEFLKPKETLLSGNSPIPTTVQKPIQTTTTNIPRVGNSGFITGGNQNFQDAHKKTPLKLPIEKKENQKPVQPPTPITPTTPISNQTVENNQSVVNELKSRFHNRTQ